MALPKLNTPTYELEQPSTGKMIKYRPFLVKEQKKLLITQQSDDAAAIQNSLAEIIIDCTFGEIDPYNVPIFDVELLFLRIRSKSVGEKVDLNLLCPDDEETRVKKTIDLEDINVIMKANHTNEIQVTDDIKMIMKYPTLGDISDVGEELDDVFKMVQRCVVEIHHGDKVYNKVDISEKELTEFIDSFTNDQFESLSEFFDTMPKVQHVVKVTNPNTKKKGEVVIEGIDNFF
mgnify:CR=1 FL=1|tara:strand:+ start:538 stop:1233 length:696 start_codon:yes stop_codon:yes gene_type:complete